VAIAISYLNEAQIPKQHSGEREREREGKKKKTQKHSNKTFNQPNLS